MRVIKKSDVIIENGTRFDRFKAKVKEKWEDLGMWYSDHKYEILFALPFVTAGVCDIGKTIRAGINLEMNGRTAKNRRIYDRSTGHYWELRRPLTTDELREIEKRKRNGENLGDILWDIKVLK